MNAATLSTTAAGESRPISTVKVGEFIWHKGAFRRVTEVVAPRVLRMGVFVLRSTCDTVEVAR
jgi:hypothetical protein